MVKIRLHTVFLIAAALMLVFVDTARSNVSKGVCTAVRVLSAAGKQTSGFHVRPVMRALQTTGGAQLFLLAEEVVPENQTIQGEPPPPQEVPLVDPTTATPPQPEPEPVDLPEQSQPPVEHEQVPEPEPAPEPALQPSQ